METSLIFKILPTFKSRIPLQPQEEPILVDRVFITQKNKTIMGLLELTSQRLIIYQTSVYDIFTGRGRFYTDINLRDVESYGEDPYKRSQKILFLKTKQGDSYQILLDLDVSTWVSKLNSVSVY